MNGMVVPSPHDPTPLVLTYHATKSLDQTQLGIRGQRPLVEALNDANKVPCSVSHKLFLVTR